MVLSQFLEGGMLVHTIHEYTEEEKEVYLAQGYHEISEEDLELYETLRYVYDFETGKPKELPVYEPALDELKKAKLIKVDAWTANKITGGLVSDCVGYTVLYDSDRDTQYKLDLALSLAAVGVLQEKYPQGFPCRGYKQLEDGSFDTVKTIHLMPAAAVIQWNTEFGEHLKKCTQEGWAKQAEVEAATSVEELESIVL